MRRTSIARQSRLLNTNMQDPNSQTSPIGISKDVRHIFRPVQVVPSSCPGPTVVGIYFGTGNVQRPSATDALMDPQLN